MRKMIAALAMGATLAVTGMAVFAGCGKKDEGVSLTVWGPQEQQAVLTKLVNDFKTANPDTTYNITVDVCSEGDAYSNVSKDPTAAADVYAYANDQIINLVNCGGLAKIGSANKAKIEAENGAGAVNAAKVGDNMYGYPFAGDNGYFLYYDKSVVTDEQTKTLEGIISACESANKKIGWALDDSWYVAGWFFAFGGTYNVEYNEDGTEKAVQCNFNNEGGVKAAKAMAKLVNSSAFAGLGTNNDTITAGFGNDYGAAVTGTWNADAIKGKLGANYGCCKLPTVTVDGETKQLSSFAGYKLMGVNATSKNLTDAHKLAYFLASESSQAYRFQEKAIGPTNTVVANSDAVKANAALAALAAQNAFAVAQTAVPANFWNPVKAFGVAMCGKEYSEDQYQSKLNDMVALIVPKTGE